MTSDTFTILLVIVGGLAIVAAIYANHKHAKTCRQVDRITTTCPNCKYEGHPRKAAKGSGLLGLFLCLACLPAGIVYFIVKGGYRYLCPKCGTQVGTDN